MKLKISVDSYKIKKVLEGWSEKALKKSAVRSANRAATSVRMEATRRMKARYNLPSSGSYKGEGGLKPPGIKPNIIIQRAKGNSKKSLGEIFATIRVSNKPISLIHFVRGEKSPLQQKGIPVKRRPLLKVQITRGNTRKMRKVFIAKANSSVQVYRKERGTMHKQSVPSLWRLLEKPEMKNQLEIFGRQVFEQEMARNLPFFTAQLSAK